MKDVISSFTAELLHPEYNGTESGYGYGHGDGYGVGCGYSNGDGYGESSASGGSGSSDGRAYGRGDSCGYGRSYGYDEGDGHGGGGLRYAKTYCGQPVYDIDGVPTLICSVRHGVAFGATLRNDLTTTPCVIVRSGHVYAHGATLREATEALRDKLCDGMTEEERIAAFWECHNRTDKYSGRDLWYWHHRLTGSCEFGRNEFAKDHSIDIDNSEFTVAEFVELCRTSYGGDVIRKLAE